MTRRSKLINKQETKRIAGKCRLCGNSSYELLDVHRINYNSENNRYTTNNTVVLCANCHRLVHDEKKIIIDRWYFSTGGNLLRIIENGVERFV